MRYFIIGSSMSVEVFKKLINITNAILHVREPMDVLIVDNPDGLVEFLSSP